MSDVYKKLDYETGRNAELSDEQINTYNDSVAVLNDTIDELEELRKKYHIDSILDVLEADVNKNITEERKAELKEYKEQYDNLFARHSNAYETYMELQEDLIYNQSRQLLEEDGRDDI